MPDYNPENGLNILSNSSDPDGDLISVRKLGESVGALAVPGAYPATYNLTIGTITVINAQGDAYVTLASSDGTNKALGTLYFTTIDEHGLESSSHGTVTINQIVDPSAPGYIDTGLVERWAADAGTTVVGSDVTDWLGQVGGLNLDAAGTATLGTPPGGTASATLVIGETGGGFTGSTLTGLPFGAQSRTVQMIWKPGSVAWFGGFGWGADAPNQSFVVSLDDGEEYGLDYKDGRLGVALQPINQWIASTATYDGTTAKVWVGDKLVASEAVALNTGTDLINLCRSFSGIQTEGTIGEILVYGRVLSDAEIVANNAYLNGRFIGSTTVSNPSAPTGAVLAETSFTANVTVNSTYAVVAWSARASSTPATESEILAGTGAISYGLAICNGTGTVALPVTGGTASTNYYVNVIAYGLTGGKSSVITSAAIQTTAAPGANPILSSASLTATGDTSASGSVTTDTGTGTLKYGVMLSTATTPNMTQLEAGTDGDGVSLIGGLRTKAVTASGAQSVSITALTASTSYKIAYGQRDGSNNASNIVTGTATTNAAPATGLTADVVAANTTEAAATLASWVGGANTPSGKTSTELRILECDFDVGGAWTINGYDFSAITEGVMVRGTGPYTWGTTYPYNPRCGTHIAGKLTVSNCDNIQIYGLTCQKFEGNGCTNLVVDRVSAQSRWSTSPTVPGTQAAFEFYSCPGGILRRSHTSGFRGYSLAVRAGSDDFQCDAIYLEHWSDDLVKVFPGSGGTIARLSFTRLTFGRENLSGSGAHSDFMQIQGGNTPDMVLWGSGGIEGGGGPNGKKFQGFYWLSNSNVSDRVDVQQNWGAGRGQNWIALAGGVDANAQFNTAFYSEWGAHGSIQPSGGGAPSISNNYATKGANVICRYSTGNADTGGTDPYAGEIITIGSVNNGGIAANTSQLPALIDGFPGEQTYIESIKPKVGGGMHWNDTNPKGSYIRMQEIFVDGVHPENDGWPCAKRFHDEYNPNSVLPSTWTGTIDADGNNA